MEMGYDLALKKIYSHISSMVSAQSINIFPTSHLKQMQQDTDASQTWHCNSS
jgi:hypothetical protein